MRFESGFEVIGRLPAFDAAQVRMTVNVHRVSPAEARETGDPIVCAFIDALPPSWAGRDVLVRSKLAWLRAGWLPGPPRWHCDQVARFADGEDDYAARSRGRHSVAAVVGDCSLTRFAVGPVELPAYPRGQPIGALVHHALEDAVARGEVEARSLPAGAVALFGEGDFHRATPATHAGWRVILRATLCGPGQARDRSAHGWRTVYNAYHPPTPEAMALYAPYL